MGSIAYIARCTAASGPPCERTLLIPEYCVKCERAIDVISPEWYRLELDVQNRRVRWQYRPDETALCAACYLDASDEAMRSKWRVTLAALQARKAAVGLRDDVTLFHQRTQNEHVSGRVRGVFQFDLYFVHCRGPLPSDCTLPRMSIAHDGQPPFLTLLNVAFDVSLDGVPAVARYTWDARDIRREGSLRIDGWSQASHPDLMRLMEGARIFCERATVGRPWGVTVHTYEDYVDAFRDTTNELGRPPKSLEEFVTRAELSPDTLKRNLRRWGTTWSAFRREHITA